MPSEPSFAEWREGGASTGAGTAEGAASAGGSAVTPSRNVVVGTKNRFPVTARLKSSSRS